MYMFCLFLRKTCKVVRCGNRYPRPQLFWRQRQKEPLRPGFQGEPGNVVKKALPTEKSGRQEGQGEGKERGRQEGGTIKRSINSYFTDELQHPKFKSVLQYHITNQSALTPVCTYSWFPIQM